MNTPGYVKVQGTQGHMLCDSVPTARADKANPEREGSVVVRSWRAEARGVTPKGPGFLFRVMEMTRSLSLGTT